jgi:hypothetical protein
MKQRRRRLIEKVDVQDVEVEAGGTHWPVQFTRQFDEDSELDPLKIEVANEDGEYRPIEGMPRDLAAGIRTGVEKWCHDNPPEPEDRDDDYERAAERARGNDFEDTDGKDWT